MPSYGQFHVAETLSALATLHVHDGITPLTTVDHEPKVGVLDQEDLIAQGIRVSTFIPGAKDVDALGSCTANATVSALSNVLSRDAFAAWVAFPVHTTDVHPYDDVVSAEKAAIRFYHASTDQTGQRSEEWPPTDCGSSGPYIVSECVKQKLASGAKIASGAQNIVSLMQSGGLLTGSPFFNSWESPDANGFIDGDGSPAALQAAIRSGLAGGHETFWSAIEKLVLTETGAVDPAKTVIRFRNSWAKGWGDNGSARFHLSTFVALGGQCDHRLLVA